MVDIKLNFNYDVDPKLWDTLSQKDKDGIEDYLASALTEYFGKCVHDKIDPGWAKKMGAKTVSINKKKVCPCCEGKGIFTFDYIYKREENVKCLVCGGSGII